MEWLGCMDMLSGGNFADGSCCHSLAKFMALCRCGRGTDFLVSVVSLSGVAAAAGIARGCFPIHLQLGITLLLMPVQIVIFHGISLTSFIANLFAIPLVTFITVPLILAAMVAHLSGPLILEQGLWFLADRSLALLFWGLKSLPEGWINIAERWQWLTFSPWFLLVVWRLNAWRTLPAMCVAVGLLMCWPLWQKPRPDE